MSRCCLEGFRWKGTPTGHETVIDDHDVYITGDNKQKAVLFLHDGFGWKLPNNRLLADHYASEIDATVYLPDFFKGTAFSLGDIEDPQLLEKAIQEFDWPKWLSTNAADRRMPAILSFARYLRQTYEYVGAVGFCWGGKPALLLASKANSGLVNAISIGHPSSVTKEDFAGVTVPIQILSPEHDPQYTQELKEYSNKVIPTLNVDYHYQYFPGMKHGFATKCDENNAKEKKALGIAKNAVVYWFSSHLA